MVRLFRLLPVFLLLGAQNPQAQTRWWVLTADDGAIVGTIAEARSPDGRESISEQRVTIQERGDSPTNIVERNVMRYDEAGRLGGIEKSWSSGRVGGSVEARIHADRAEIVRSDSVAAPRRATVALPPGTRFDNGAGLLPGWDRTATPQLEFRNFNLEAMAVDRVVIAPIEAPPGLAEGRTALQRRSYEGDELRGVQLLILGPDGRVTETHQPLFGSVLIVRPSTQEEASRPIPPYQPLTRALSQSPFRIPAGALNGRIRYRFTFRHGIAFPLLATGEQRGAIEGGVATLNICATCGPGLPVTPEALAEATRPTAWLQSDHASIRSLSAPVRYRGVSAHRKMEALVRIAEQQILEIDFAGHFSAVETLRRRRGDCTESAVLLAALGRSIGIPTKVVSGLVYSRGAYHGSSNVFLPHSWVIAYVDGRWRSYDAALGDFDATHIALTIGDGDTRSISAANQLAGLIQWTEMQEVRVRPGS